MPRVLTVVVAVLAAVAVGAAVYFYRENQILREELAALRSRPSPVVAGPTEPAAAPVKATTDPAVTPVSAGTPATPIESTAEAAPARGGQRRGGDWRERGPEYMAQALADPASRAALLSRAKSQIDRMFGDYFVKLGLNETQIEALRTLLAERQMVRMESGMLERTAATDQERADAQSFRDAKLATTERDINSILGPDGLKNLQAYVESAPQRQVIDDIARRATYAGAPLSSEASDRLLQTVQQASAAFPLPQLPGRGRWNGGDASSGVQQPLTADIAATYMQDLRARNQQIIDRSREFLTQSQLEALADQQIDEMQQTEAQLNFMVRNPDARGPGVGFGGGGGRVPGG